MRLWILAIPLVVLVACGGGGLSEEEVDSRIATEVARAVDREVPTAVNREVEMALGAVIREMDKIFRVLNEDFAASGERAAKAAERDTVQTAIETMIADKKLTSVTANSGPAAKVTSSTDFGGGHSIAIYIRGLPTAYCYTWTDKGVVTQADCP